MEPEINTIKIVKRNFIKAYGMVPAMYQTQLREAIIEECDWSGLSIFHHKRKGKSKIFHLEIPVIEKHFAKYNIDAWTGEYLS